MTCKAVNSTESLNNKNVSNYSIEKKQYKKQISEFVDEIDLKNCIKLNILDEFILDRYYFDLVENKLYLKKSRGKGYKLIKPTFNGCIDVIPILLTDGSSTNRSFQKIITCLKNLIN